MKHPQLLLISLVSILLSLPSPAQETTNATGFVYDDRNRNGKRDPGEPGLPNVLVSNQREVVRTDLMGRWTLPVRDDCIFFVIKPRGWMPPVSEQQLPRFYYLHKPKGSPQSKFPGVKPTGPLPPSIDFALTRQDEPFKFKAHFFGDTQSRNARELDFMARDTIQELIGTDAEFGVTLGDILFDDLSLFETHNSIVALMGIQDRVQPGVPVVSQNDVQFGTVDRGLALVTKVFVHRITHGR